MDTYEFLSTVLPPETNDYYCVVELSVKNEHKFSITLADVVEDAQTFGKLKRETYYAVATFKTDANRLAINASSIRCLFADIDVGDSKPYKTPRKALAGIEKYCTETEFPLPLIVDSGHGIHAYWPFTAAVSIAAWKPVAEAFKLSCEKHGLHIDYSVSADAARVLRVPGTHNRKVRHDTKLVRVMNTAIVQPFEEYKEKLESFLTPAPAPAPKKDDILDNAPAYAKTGASFRMALADIAQSNFDKILALGDKGCLQINHYVNNASQDGMEPLWRAVMSIAKFCVNGEEKAHELARLHPYDTVRTDKKLSEILGPHNCTTFEKLHPSICDKCVNKGKIKNPIQLGLELKKQEEKEVEVQVGSVVQKQAYPTPPEGYILGERGVGIQFSDEAGIPRIAYVSDTPFYATNTYDRAGERFVQFTYVEHETAKSTVMPLSMATGRDEAIKAFAKVGVMVPNGQDNGFRAYVKATIAEAKKRPPLLMPTSLGWQTDDTFAFDSRIFSKDTEHIVPMYGFDNVNATIGTKGTLDGWCMVIHGLIQLERWDILSMMLVGFAAPLMKFTGLAGVTFHLCGNNSGLGKTLCQRLASSVWGHPDKFRITPNTSSVAMLNRLGMLGNLPLLVDEITHKGRNDSEWFPEFLSQMSDGRGKDRMESSSNAERRNTTTWATIALMTSNKNMMDYLTAERAHTSEGEIRRLVEIVFFKELKLTPLIQSLFIDTLPNNYGVAGEAYAKWLVRNVDVVRKFTKEMYTEVFSRFGAAGDERFWIAGCSTILAAAALLGKQNADIIDLPIVQIRDFLLNTVKHMREESKRNKRTALDVLNEFTKRNFGKLVVVNDRVTKISGVEVAEIEDRRDVCGRVEKGHTKGWVDYFIEARTLKAFCSSLSYGFSEFEHDLNTGNGDRSRACPVAFLRKDILSGIKGPTMQVKVAHIKLPVEEANMGLFEQKAANE